MQYEREFNDWEIVDRKLIDNLFDDKDFLDALNNQDWEKVKLFGESIIDPKSYFMKFIVNLCWKVGIRTDKLWVDIPNNFFESCPYYLRETDLTIPDYIRKIGKEAFSCAEYTNIKLSEGVEDIEPRAFEYSDLEQITLPKSLKSVSVGVFSNCDSLKKIIYNGTTQEFDQLFANKGTFEDCETTTPIIVECANGTISIGKRDEF